MSITYQIEIYNKSHCLRVQQYLLDHGYYWFDGDTLKHIESKYLFFRVGETKNYTITHADRAFVGETSEYTTYKSLKGTKKEIEQAINKGYTKPTFKDKLKAVKFWD